MSGIADIAPYAAGGARLALAPVRFAARPDGWTQVSTVALLDGPFGGGRVTGLRVPIDGRFGPGGALRVRRGLHRRALRQLAAWRAPAWPDAAAAVPDRAGDPLPPRRAARSAFGAATRNVQLRGQLGKSPFALDAARARMLGQRDFEAAALALRLGQSDFAGADQRQDASTAPSRAAAFRGLSRAPTRTIGTVPLLL